MGRKKERVPGWNSFVAVTDDEAASVAVTESDARFVEMSDAEYHDSNAISKTRLSEFLDSSYVYHLTYNMRTMSRKQATRTMDIGSIVHAFVLDQKQLDEIVAVIPHNCLKSNGAINSSGDNYKAFVAENDGKYVIKSETLDEIGNCIGSIVQSPLWECVQAATGRERALFWTDDVTGLECRCKPDFYAELDDHVVCYDLKVSKAIDPESFRRQVKRFRYWLQDAHYSAGLKAKFNKPVTFRFWVVEPVRPYRVIEYHLDATVSRTTAVTKWEQAMYRLSVCKSSNQWSDDWGGTIVLTEWDFGDVDSADSEVVFDG